jgi:predicted naringenin-chalcone synthase
MRTKIAKIVAGSGIETRGAVCADVPSSRFLPRLEEPGTRGRFWEEGAKTMALVAARAALASWRRGSARDVTHVVVHSCTGFSAPGLDFHLITGLGLPRDTRKVGVNFMGCFGAFTSLYVAKQIVEADTTGRACVLVVCAETCSVHVTREPRIELVIGNTLFADGAGAAIVTGAHWTGGHPVPAAEAARAAAALPPNTVGRDLGRMSADGRTLQSLWGIGTMVSDIVPDSGDAMTWRQSSEGGRYDMFLDRAIPKALASTFASSGLDMLRRVGIMNPWSCAWAIHPGGKAILDVFSKSLSAMQIKGEGLEASIDVLRTYGNMSSPTILFVLQRILAQTQRDNVFVAGFGPGLTVEYGRIHRVQVGPAGSSSSSAADASAAQRAAAAAGVSLDAAGLAAFGASAGTGPVYTDADAGTKRGAAAAGAASAAAAGDPASDPPSASASSPERSGNASEVEDVDAAPVAAAGGKAKKGGAATPKRRAGAAAANRL